MALKFQISEAGHQGISALALLLVLLLTLLLVYNVAVADNFAFPLQQQ